MTDIVVDELEVCNWPWPMHALSNHNWSRSCILMVRTNIARTSIICKYWICAWRSWRLMQGRHQQYRFEITIRRQVFLDPWHLPTYSLHRESLFLWLPLSKDPMWILAWGGGTMAMIPRALFARDFVRLGNVFFNGVCSTIFHAFHNYYGTPILEF